jgi:hypothetical protein
VTVFVQSQVKYRTYWNKAETSVIDKLHSSSSRALRGGEPFDWKISSELG